MFYAKKTHVFLLVQPMQWQIPDIPDLYSQPKRTRLNSPVCWLLGLGILYLPAVPILWLVHHKENAVFWLVAVLPAAIWLFAALSVFVLLHHRYTVFESWEEEKRKIHEKWTCWAHQGIDVLDAGIVLPDAPQIGGIRLFKRKGDDYLNIDMKAFNPFLSSLSSLPIHLKNIRIYIATENFDSWKEKLSSLISQEHALWNRKVEFIPTALHLEFIDQLLQWQTEGIHIVFFAAVNEKTDSHFFIENTAWIILMTKSYATSNRLESRVRIQRPLDLDFSNMNDTGRSLKLFKRYGMHDLDAEIIWYSETLKKQKNILETALIDEGISVSAQRKDAASLYSKQDGFLILDNIPQNCAWLDFIAVICYSMQQNYKHQLVTWSKTDTSVGIAFIHADK